jgi:hypothetical protein
MDSDERAEVKDEIHIHVVHGASTERAEAFIYQAAQEWIRAYGNETDRQTTVGSAFLSTVERLFWRVVANSESPPP